MDFPAVEAQWWGPMFWHTAFCCFDAQLYFDFGRARPVESGGALLDFFC
jgi:hypothetical protein